MFRAQANPMDDAIVKATDENLVNENWEYILDVCDRVSASPSGPQQAVAALIKRLAHRNANVQVYTLELANALSQNCGPALHRELASRAFTEALLRLAGDRNTHAQVKQKVLERMETWTEEFGKSPDFGIMADAYRRLRTTQPSLQAPSKPGKREISVEDRKKEEDELQQALALSVQDNKPKVNGTVREDSELPAQASAGAPQVQGNTAATVSRVRALYDFTPSEAGELAFRKGDIIAVLESVFKDWWKGSLRGQTGIFPLNYVEKLQDPTKDELERDAQMEAEVFGEVKNVERLLALLSVHTEGGAGRRGERDEEEISELYQRTLSIRPKLIELIGRYSQKKDDFTQLNEKFIKARRDYEALLESSMTQPQHYGQYNARRYPQQPQPYGQPPASSYAQPPQSVYGQPQQYAAQPPQQDIAQRFYSPAPQEQPGQAAGYGPAQFASQPGAPAAFHFIPGGMQPPGQDQSNMAIRRKASPQQPPSAAPSEMGVPTSGGYPVQTAPNIAGGYASQAPQNAYAAQPSHYTPTQGPPQGAYAPNQARPQSIHTLNSGNPQELATGGYESPIDNRRSYIAPQAPPQQSVEAYAPGQAPQQAPSQQQTQLQQPTQPQQQIQPQQAYPTYQQAPAMHSQSAVPAPLQPHGQRSDLNSLPSRQRTQSFDSTYSGQQSVAPDHSAYSGQQSIAPNQSAYSTQHVPPSMQPSGPPPGVPMDQYQQQYQAYNPNMPATRAPAPAGAGDDPGDYYR